MECVKVIILSELQISLSATCTWVLIDNKMKFYFEKEKTIITSDIKMPALSVKGDEYRALKLPENVSFKREFHK